MKTYLSRREAAKKYNVSIAKLRRWEEKGKLRRMDADLVELNTSRSDSAVQWVYEEEQLRDLVETETSRPKHIVPRNRDAKVFELFDAGKNLVEVVRQTKLPVKDVRPLRDIHVQETGSLFLSGPIAAQMEQQWLPREYLAKWPTMIKKIRKAYRVKAARLRLAEEALRALGHEVPKLSSSLQKDFDDEDDESSSE